jgi:hypothetical protein
VCRTAALAKLDASGGGGTSVPDFRVGGRTASIASLVDRAFIERAENRFRGSFSRKALEFHQLEKTRFIGGSR